MMLDTAVIPCGGLGTRLHPITRWLPKEVLPVGLKPVLYWTLDEAAGAGLLRAIIITNPHKPMLESVARNYQGPLELEFVPQDHPRGLGDALLRARDNLAGSPFIAVLPDNLFHGPNPTGAVLDTFRTTGLATVLLTEIERKEAGSKGATGRAAVREQSDGSLRVVAVADKGSGRFDTAGADKAVTPIGRMAFGGAVLGEFEEVGRSLASGAELDDVPVLQRLAQRDALAGVMNPARFFDVGVPEGYREAVAAFSSPGVTPDRSVDATFNHCLLELTSINTERLRDTDVLSALVVAAAGAVGMPGLGPPVARQGAGEIAVALLCLEGHIVLHCAPAEGVCLIDIVARAPADVGKGIDVISRRLSI